MKSEKRQMQMAKKRAAKRSMFLAAEARGDVGGKSKYAKKIARKLGSGTVDHTWMWWSTRGL